MANDPSEDGQTAQPGGDSNASSGTPAQRRYRRYRSSRKPADTPSGQESSQDQPTPEATPVGEQQAAVPKRRHRGGVKHRRGQRIADTTPAADATAEEVPPSPPVTEASAEGEPGAAKPRRRRGGVRHRHGQRSPEAEAAPDEVTEHPVVKATRLETKAPVAPGEAKESSQPAAKPRRHRGGVRHRRGRQAAEPVAPPPIGHALIDEDWPDEEISEDGAEAAARSARDGGNGSGPRVKPFMHPSEGEFSKILDYYGIKYLYEPRSFPLRWDGNRVVEMFTPDFYLPAQDQYVELTTMKQNLVTQKNRKLRRVRELYPEVNVMLLYRRDLLRLLGKYGYGPMSDVEVGGVQQILFTEEQIQQRVQELGAQITKDYAGKEPILIGVLRGVVVFMADLMREIDLPMQISFMEISHYGEDEGGGVEVTKDVDTDIAGKPVILVEDIVDTGMTATRLLKHLEGKRPASVAVCALLDKTVRRMVPVPVHYRGFDIPDEFVVGYGLDFQGHHRNLPYIGVLKPAEPKDIPHLQGFLAD